MRKMKSTKRLRRGFFLTDALAGLILSCILASVGMEILRLTSVHARRISTPPPSIHVKRGFTLFSTVLGIAITLCSVMILILLVGELVRTWAFLQAGQERSAQIACLLLIRRDGSLPDTRFTQMSPTRIEIRSHTPRSSRSPSAATQKALRKRHTSVEKTSSAPPIIWDITPTGTCRRTVGDGRPVAIARGCREFRAARERHHNQLSLCTIAGTILSSRF